MSSIHRAYVYLVTPKEYREGLEYRFHVGEIPPFDPEPFALIAGDCLFNLRAALDHIVYALHARSYKGNVPADAERQSAFPIHAAPPKDKRGVPKPTSDWSQIERLSIRQQRAIEFLQPYRARNDQFRWARPALADLTRLNNIDKHRHLHVVRREPTGAPSPRFPPEYGFRLIRPNVPLKSHAEMFRWTFTRVPPDIAEHMKFEQYAIAEVILNEGGAQTPLLPFLEHLINNVDMVIRRFEVFLR